MSFNKDTLLMTIENQGNREEGLLSTEKSLLHITLYEQNYAGQISLHKVQDTFN